MRNPPLPPITTPTPDRHFVEATDSRKANRGTFTVKQMMGMARECNDRGDRIALLEEALRGAIELLDDCEIAHPLKWENALTTETDKSECVACHGKGEIYKGGTVPDPWLEPCPDCSDSTETDNAG